MLLTCAANLRKDLKSPSTLLFIKCTTEAIHRNKDRTCTFFTDFQQHRQKERYNLNKTIFLLK
jgi:hypothetical protein